MKVKGILITQDQITAGLKAMTGDFKMGHIVAAMVKAGVPYHVSRNTRTLHIAERAVDRLLQGERKAGRIKTGAKKNIWVRV